MMGSSKTTFLFTVLLLLLGGAPNTYADGATEYITQTVYGFLDFTTTIGNTVMVFSPNSAPPLVLNLKPAQTVKVIETKPLKMEPKHVENEIQPTKLDVLSKTKAEVKKTEIAKPAAPKAETSKVLPTTGTTPKPTIISPKKSPTQPPLESSEIVLPSKENTEVYMENNLYQPEYDLLSRQPTEYIDETFRVVNINPSSSRSPLNKNRHTKVSKPPARSSASASQVLAQPAPSKNFRERPSPSLTRRVLKTAAPQSPKPQRYSPTEAPTPATTSSVKSSHRQSSSTKRLRKKNSAARNHTPSNAQKTNEVVSSSSSSSSSSSTTTSHKPKHSKPKNRKHSRNSATATSTTAAPTSDNTGRRAFRVKPAHEAPPVSDATSSLYMFQLNRTPGRWQYKTSPKPKINIRKAISEQSGTTIQPHKVPATSIGDQLGGSNDSLGQNAILSQGDLESSGSQNGNVINNADVEDRRYLVETLNVEISTPADFKDTYYEIATIKTPYTFRAGAVSKTRFITVTSTFKKILEPEPTATATFDGPLTENILVRPAQRLLLDKKLLEGSISTLEPLYLSKGEETPSLETVTESYTLTQTKLGTHVLPVVWEGENSTSFMTAVQTYDITNLITITKTYLPSAASHFVAVDNLNDFSINLDTAGSEINLDLEFGDEDNAEYAGKNKLNNPDADLHGSKPTSASINPLLQQKQQKPLLNTQFNPYLLTTTRPIIRPQTLWESHVIPIKNGQSTSYRTLSKSIGVVDRTEYETEIITLPSQLPVATPQLSINPYLLQTQQQFQTITTPLVEQRLVTEVSSKVLKLTFGAKTAYTTLFSTQVVPTIITTFITTAIPVQPTANPFAGYFPAPFPQYPFVG